MALAPLPRLRLPLLISSFFFLLFPASSHADTFTVDRLGDDPDLNPGDGSCDVSFVVGSQCTLRAALQEANAHSGDDRITFSVSGTITVGSELPTITEHLTLEGVSDYSAPPEIAIDGSAVTDTLANGLTIRADVVDIIGLSIINFPENGVLISGNRNGIVDCYVGVALDGSSAGNGNDGISVVGDENVIGVPGYGRNVISANGTSSGPLGDGVSIVSGSGNEVQNNYVGLDPTGTRSYGNDLSGVYLGEEATNTLIGGSSADARNVISGNNSGIQLAGTNDNAIRGNYIGTSSTGDAAVPNGIGILLFNGASNNEIGGPGDGEGNLISASDISAGVSLRDLGTTDNTIQGNLIGVDISGDVALGNELAGIHMTEGASDNVVGGSAEGAGNVISGNEAHGILLNGDATTGNEVKNNTVGLDADGDVPVPNDRDGIRIRQGASDNVVGDTTFKAENVISGNEEDGIRIKDAGTTGNTIIHNVIGLTVTGTPNPGNGRHGINVTDEAGSMLIGAPTKDSTNVIGENAHVGIRIGATTSDIDVRGNIVGTAFHEEDLGNVQGGISVNGSDHTVSENFVGFNGWGVRIGGYAEDNLFLGNFVGESTTGADIGNDGFGILIAANEVSTPTNNVIGTPISGTDGFNKPNVIANNGDGIIVRSASEQFPTRNTIRVNRIARNDELGIDLGGDGETSNDDSDGDDGAHRLQNFPVIQRSGYDTSTGEVSVTYSVPSDPSLSGSGASAYDLTIDFYRADADDQEGAAYLGTDTYSTSDYSGCGTPPCTVTTTFTPLSSVSGSDHVVATATDANGNTSEFSATPNPLPVELAQFRATVSGRESVELSWETTSETNNARFEVQRTDAVDSRPADAETVSPDDGQWQTVGSLRGAGTTQRAHRYSLTDEFLPFEARRIRYRLVQYDLNGRSEVVADETVDLGAPVQTELRPPAPNPARGQATLRYALSEKKQVRITLFDVVGRKIRTVVHAQQRGRQEVELQTSSLSAGMYFVRMTADDITRTRRLTVVR